MINPPIHSHRIIGFTNTRIVADGVTGDRARVEREVDVLGQPGAHRRGADIGSDVQVRRGGRPVDRLAVEDHVRREHPFALAIVGALVDRFQLERVAAPFDDLALLERAAWPSG